MVTFTYTMTEFEAANEMSEGRCVECGASAPGVEPDAKQYTCDKCKQPGVYGVEELLLMGVIILRD